MSKRELHALFADQMMQHIYTYSHSRTRCAVGWLAEMAYFYAVSSRTAVLLRVSACAMRLFCHFAVRAGCWLSTVRRVHIALDHPEGPSTTVDRTALSSIDLPGMP